MEIANYRRMVEDGVHEDVDPSTLIPIPAPDPDETVTIHTDEVSGFCPVEYEDGSGVRDYYEIVVQFDPNEEDPQSIELKSLKLYLEQFQDLPISHEDLANTVKSHLEGLIDPEAMYVWCQPNIRGGITTSIELGEPLTKRAVTELGYDGS